MIRWSYVWPRCVILVCACAIVQHATPPILRRAIVGSGGPTIGAKIEVGDVDFSLANLRVALNNVALSDPEQPDCNLVEFDRILLDIDGASLLRKKTVVQAGRISGVRFGAACSNNTSPPVTTGDTMGVLSPCAVWAERVASAATTEVQKWALRTVGNIESDLTNSLESPSLLDSLAARWSQDMRSIQTRMNDIHIRGAALHQQGRDIESNPLRRIEAASRHLQEANSLRAQSDRVLAAANELHPRIERDLRTIEEAKARDIQELRSLELASLDPCVVNEYLLSREISGRVGVALRWLGRARQFAARDQRVPERGRGWDVLFAGRTRRPDYLIRSLAIDGESEMDGRPVAIVGSAIGLTTRPKEYGRPTIVKLATSGAATMSINASFDRTGDVPVDHLTVHCPSLAIPIRTLGGPDLLAIEVSPCTAEFHADLTIAADELSGRIRLAGHNLSMRPHIGEKLAGATPTIELESALAQVRTISATAHVDGTLNEPTWRIESDLGEIVAARFAEAFRTELARKRTMFAANLEHKIKSQVAENLHNIERQHRELLATLKEERELLLRLVDNFSGEFGSSTELIGRLPGGAAPR